MEIRDGDGTELPSGECVLDELVRSDALCPLILGLVAERRADFEAAVRSPRRRPLSVPSRCDPQQRPYSTSTDRCRPGRSPWIVRCTTSRVHATCGILAVKMTHTQPDPIQLAETLRVLGERAVRGAADVLRDRFGASDLRISTKGSPADVVTDADLASERVRCATVPPSNRPADGMLAEEGTSIEGTSGVSWVLDPIDSTANFARGIPIWSISLAAMDARGVLAGVVAFPPGGEVISATADSGVLLNGSRTSLGPPPSLSAAMVAVGWGPRSSGRRQGHVAGSLIHRVGKVRSPGSPALGLAWTASRTLRCRLLRDGLQRLGRRGRSIPLRVRGLDRSTRTCRRGRQLPSTPGRTPGAAESLAVVRPRVAPTKWQLDCPPRVASVGQRAGRVEGVDPEHHDRLGHVGSR